MFGFNKPKSDPRDVAGETYLDRMRGYTDEPTQKDFTGYDEYRVEKPMTSVTCVTCGCLVDPRRVQAVYTYNNNDGTTVETHYCVIHALPYDYVRVVCEHETHYFQYGEANASTEVLANGKPLPKKKVA